MKINNEINLIFTVFFLIMRNTTLDINIHSKYANYEFVADCDANCPALIYVCVLCVRVCYLNIKLYVSG